MSFYFLGYMEDTKGYLFYALDTRIFFTSRNVVFYVKHFSFHKLDIIFSHLPPSFLQQTDFSVLHSNDLLPSLSNEG